MTAGAEDAVATVDGMLEPEDVAEACVRSIEAEEFLVLPHPQVFEYMRRKTGDYDRWIRGMERTLLWPEWGRIMCPESA